MRVLEKCIMNHLVQNIENTMQVIRIRGKGPIRTSGCYQLDCRGLGVVSGASGSVLSAVGVSAAQFRCSETLPGRQAS